MTKRRIKSRPVAVVIEVISAAPLQAYIAGRMQLMVNANLAFGDATPYRKGWLDALEGVKEYIAKMDKMEALIE
jgi:hypothetical protein